MRAGIGVHALAVVLCWSAPARAGWLALQPPALTITKTTAGLTSSFDVPLTQTSTRFSVGGDGASYAVDTPEGAIAISGFLDSDPLVATTLSVTDFGSPTDFHITVAMLSLVPPVAGASLVRASLSGSLTAVGGNGVSFIPLGGPHALVSTLAPLATSMGVDVGAGFSTGVAPNGTYAYPADDRGFAVPVFGPPGTWDTLTVSMNFRLSGGGDGATFAIYSEIIPVPAPASSLLTALALVACIGTGRSRARTR